MSYHKGWMIHRYRNAIDRLHTDSIRYPNSITPGEPLPPESERLECVRISRCLLAAVSWKVTRWGIYLKKGVLP